MKKFVLLSSIICFTAFTAFGAIVELNDSQLAQFYDTGWDPGNSHTSTDIAGDPGTRWDITYGPHGGWAGYDVRTWPATFGIGAGDTWQITITNLSPYYIYMKPYIRADDGDAAWHYVYGDEGYLDPAGTVTPNYLGDSYTFSVTNPYSVEREILIQTDVPGWSGSNLPAGGDVISLLITPEPATIAILGLGGLVLRRRRKA